MSKTIKESLASEAKRKKTLVYESPIEDVVQFVRKEAISGDKMGEDISIRLSKSIQHLSLLEIFTIISIIKDSLEEDSLDHENMCDTGTYKMICMMYETMVDRIHESWKELPHCSVQSIFNITK